MQEAVTTALPSGRTGVTDALRVQILATEHSSPLATRGMIWNEMFACAGMYPTVLSAATVALALVAQATDFGGHFRLFALLVLPIVFILGYGTQTRLGDARAEEVWRVVGMNRLRHAYLELAPELAPYFVTSLHDDEAGVIATYGPVLPGAARVAPGRILAGTPELVGVINAAVAGVLAALVVEAVAGSVGAGASAGVVGGLAYLAAYGVNTFRQLEGIRREYRPRFPGPDRAAR
ncbi:MAG: hypothetical protein M3462_08055 [Chloroflexota bacterium]|nr:hypothetical protein [Chloroflexota bacterium]